MISYLTYTFLFYVFMDLATTLYMQLYMMVNVDIENRTTRVGHVLSVECVARAE